MWHMREAEAAAAAAAAAAVAAQHGGAARLRGVYVPLERRPLEPDPAAAAQGAEQGAVQLRGALRLPPEGTLPRRNEPAGW